MSRVLILVTILFFAASVHSKEVGNDVALQATTYADGVLFEAGSPGMDYTLTVSGPANVAFERQAEFSKPSFISISGEEEGPLPDGLYKYEAPGYSCIYDFAGRKLKTKGSECIEW